VAHVDDVDAHVRDDAQQAHQFAGAVGQACMDDEVAASRSQTMLDETAHQVDIDVTAGQRDQHFFTRQFHRAAQEVGLHYKGVWQLQIADLGWIIDDRVERGEVLGAAEARADVVADRDLIGEEGEPRIPIEEQAHEQLVGEFPRP